MAISPAVRILGLSEKQPVVIETPTRSYEIQISGEKLDALISGRLDTSSDTKVADLLYFLVDQGVVIGDQGRLPDVALDVAFFNADVSRMSTNQMTIAVNGEGETRDIATATLREWGCNVIDNQRDTLNAIVACGRGSDDAQLLEINEIALKRNVPCVFTSTDRALVRIGPVVLPGETACYQCVTTRRWAYLKNRRSTGISTLAAAENTFRGAVICVSGLGRIRHDLCGREKRLA